MSSRNRAMQWRKQSELLNRRRTICSIRTLISTLFLFAGNMLRVENGVQESKDGNGEQRDEEDTGVDE